MGIGGVGSILVVGRTLFRRSELRVIEAVRSPCSPVGRYIYIGWSAMERAEITWNGMK